MSDEPIPKVPWTCPWNICTLEQAAACRADAAFYTRGVPKRDTCGTRFPAETTPLQAWQLVQAPERPNAALGLGGAK
jgi:hypothetical protein